MGVIDQCGIQNRNNDGRQYYDKDDDEGNIKKEHIERLKINGNGFQMVNGNSLILCQPNTRTFEFIKSLIQLRIANCNDSEINQILINILLHDDLDENKIFEELNKLFEEVDVKEEMITFIETTKSSKNNLLSKIKNKADSLNPNIVFFQKFMPKIYPSNFYNMKSSQLFRKIFSQINQSIHLKYYNLNYIFLL